MNAFRELEQDFGWLRLPKEPSAIHSHAEQLRRKLLASLAEMKSDEAFPEHLKLGATRLSAYVEKAYDYNGDTARGLALGVALLTPEELTEVIYRAGVMPEQPKAHSETYLYSILKPLAPVLNERLTKFDDFTSLPKLAPSELREISEEAALVKAKLAPAAPDLSPELSPLG